MCRTVSALFKLAFLTLAFNANANTEYYEYEFIDKKNNSKVTLRLSEMNVNKYPGRTHSRNRSVNTSLWFPSLKDASSPNAWLSTKEEQDKAKIKPSNNDRKLNLTLGNIGPNVIVDPNEIYGNNPISDCKTEQSFEKFDKEGTKGIFDHYKNVKRRATSQDKHLYKPTEKVKGIGCVVCNGVTCQLFGVSDFGIQYVATEAFIGNKMLDEVLNIHAGINKFIERKVVNKLAL